MLDGQQRLRALSLGFREQTGDNRCLWVELGDGSLGAPKLLLTSAAQPFGYREQGEALRDHELRDARAKLNKGIDERFKDGQWVGLTCRESEHALRRAYDHELFHTERNTIKASDGSPLLHRPAPYRAKRAIELRPLLEAWLNAPSDAREALRRAATGLLEARYGHAELSSSWIEGLAAGFVEFARARMAAIVIEIEPDRSKDLHELFIRIGENVVRLSQAEKLYSTFKFHMDGNPDLARSIGAWSVVDRILDYAVAGHILNPPTLLAPHSLLRGAERRSGRTSSNQTSYPRSSAMRRLQHIAP